MKEIIYSTNELYDLVEMLEDEESVLDPWKEAHAELDRRLDDEVLNLSSIKLTRGVAIGNIERWDKRRSAYKSLKSTNLGDAIRETMSLFGGDNSFTVYLENEDVTISQTSHDNPVNPSVVVIRDIRPDVDDILYKASKQAVSRRTQKLGNNVRRVYGW